jgi:DNA-binding NarL/FixJ family response regulator
MIRLVIVDDQRLIREGLAELLSPHFEIVGQAANGSDAIKLCREARPNVALIDVVMPVMDGPTCARLLLADGLVDKVIAMTTYDADEHVFAMVNAGASGFVLKDIDPTELVATINLAMSGSALLAPAALHEMIARHGKNRRPLPSGPNTPTPRELDVVIHIARGLSNSEIAHAMFLSESTIKTHIGRVFEKFDCRDRAQLVIAAYETGLVHPGELP